VPVVTYLSLNPPELTGTVVAGLRKGLSEAGFIDGRNVALEFRSADNQVDKLPELVADLVAGNRCHRAAAEPEQSHRAQQSGGTTHGPNPEPGRMLGRGNQSGP
jgi:putative ABC transport system substrate-binding protein